MTNFRAGRRLAVAAAVVSAAVGSAAPAQASPNGTPADCDVRVERLEAQFYEMAERRSYEAASDWWDTRWQAYCKSCILH